MKFEIFGDDGYLASFHKLVWLCLCLFILNPGYLAGGTNGYYFPFQHTWAEQLIPFADGLLVLKDSSKKLSYVELQGDRYVEIWDSDAIGFEAWQLEKHWIAVEENRIILIYKDTSNRAAGIVLEKAGNFITEIGSIDMSQIRGPEFHDRVSIGPLFLHEDNLFIEGYADSPVCIVWSRSGNDWVNPDEILVHYHPGDATRSLIGVTGNGDEQTFFMFRKYGYDSTTGLSSFFLECYRRNPTDWELVQTVEFNASRPYLSVATVFNPEGDHFLVIGQGPYEGDQIHEFKQVNGNWTRLGTLEISSIDFSTTDTSFPIMGSNSFILETVSGELHLIRYVNGEWRTVAVDDGPKWPSGFTSHWKILTDDLFIALGEYFEPIGESYTLAALYSAMDFSPVSIPWFDTATYFHSGTAWLSNLGYFYPENSINPAGTWIYSHDLGWLYITSKDASNLSAWSYNMKMWIQLESTYYNAADGLYFVFAYHPGEYLWHDPGTILHPWYFSYRLDHWISNFDLPFYLNSYSIEPDFLEELDDELLVDDPSIQSAIVSIFPSGNWHFNIRMVEDNETIWITLHGTWNLYANPAGFSCEGTANIQISSITVKTTEGSVSLDPQTLWLDHQIEMPAVVTINIVFQSSDTGYAWGDFMFNSGRFESLEPFEFP